MCVVVSNRDRRGCLTRKRNRLELCCAKCVWRVVGFVPTVLIRGPWELQRYINAEHICVSIIHCLAIVRLWGQWRPDVYVQRRVGSVLRLVCKLAMCSLTVLCVCMCGIIIQFSWELCVVGSAQVFNSQNVNSGRESTMLMLQ